MRGLYDELREATAALELGRIDITAAREKLYDGAKRLGALRARNLLAKERSRQMHGPYEDEIYEIETAVQELLAAVEARAPRVRIFHRPGRNVTIRNYSSQDIRARLPDIQVVRVGQVEFIELDGRLRVRDWWELLIEGKPVSPPIQGPKRWIMKNAAGAAMMDAEGKPPAWMLLTGLARRRALHKRRRDRRRKAAFRRALHEQKRRGKYLVLRGTDVRVDLRFGEGHPRAGEPVRSFTLADLNYPGRG